MGDHVELATGIDENGQQVAYIDTGDGNYTAIPLSAVTGVTGMDSQEVMINLDQLNMMNDGEEMVVIAADENMDMATLESLIASGAVSTIQVDENSDMLQHLGGDGHNLEGAQVIELTPDQMQMLDLGGRSIMTADGTTILNTGGLGGAGQNFPGISSQGGITYRCPSCPAMYANANAFTKHMREKHFVKVFTCRQCQEFFETLSQLFLHARRSHVDPKKPKRNPANFKFHCNQCNYMTNNGGTMEHHKRAHTGEKPYMCDVCGKRFAQKANMKTHRNRHIHRERIFRCETCNKAFSSYDIYLAHLRTREHELREHFQMIASSQLSLECLGCTATFESIYNLNKHTRSCRIVRTLHTKFRCLPCDEYVSDVSSLKAHVKSHEGSHIISCPVCGERGFPGFNQLNHHITRAHALKVNRRHVCRYCESTFETKKEVDGHIRSMHAEERNARQSRGAVGRLRCRYGHCEFTTNSIMLLDRHHDQHRRQEEDGDDYSMPLPPARNASGTKRRGRPPKLPSAETGGLGSSGGVVFPEGFLPEDEEDYELAEEEDEDLIDEHDVVRRTITLIKSSKADGGAASTSEIQSHLIGGDDEDTIDPLDMAEFEGASEDPSTTTSTTVNTSGDISIANTKLPPTMAPAYKATTSSTSATPTSTRGDSNRKRFRARRLPAWYKDYDTDFVVQAEQARAELQAQLPPGLELQDPMDVKMDVPTEEWNIVVYDEDDLTASSAVADTDPIEGSASVGVTVSPSRATRSRVIKEESGISN